MNTLALLFAYDCWLSTVTLEVFAMLYVRNWVLLKTVLLEVLTDMLTGIT